MGELHGNKDARVNLKKGQTDVHVLTGGPIWDGKERWPWLDERRKKVMGANLPRVAEFKRPRCLVHQTKRTSHQH